MAPYVYGNSFTGMETSGEKGLEKPHRTRQAARAEGKVLHFPDPPDLLRSPLQRQDSIRMPYSVMRSRFAE